MPPSYQHPPLYEAWARLEAEQVGWGGVADEKGWGGVGGKPMGDGWFGPAQECACMGLQCAR